MNSCCGLTQKQIGSIINILKKHTDIQVCIIFGSRAKGTQNKSSDVDMVLQGTELTHRTIASVHFKLNEETNLPYKFDVLNYHTITNNNLIDHINRVGVCIYKKEG